MDRAYYNSKIEDFLIQDNNSILGEIAKNNQFDLELTQKNTWINEINILKQALKGFEEGTILFEYTIPRIGNRIDNVIIYKGIIYLLEFKCGDSKYHNYAINQVTDYALDLKNFHKESHNAVIVPILISTEANERENHIQKYEDNIYKTLLCNKYNFKNELNRLNQIIITKNYIDSYKWINSIYMPTPTIIEAAQALYRGHDVKEISRNDAGARNLNETTKAINNIIEDSKANNKKSICFITGVPGAGKTLAGLNIANERHKFDEDEHAIFLSGNGPLVDVLQEALTRDDAKKKSITKEQAKTNAKAFIQIIHHFRDDALSVDTAPIEKVVIFDEAQRAWNMEQTSSFMQKKKGVLNFHMSEPEFLISIMDRHKDWSVIICLIGGRSRNKYW